MNAFGEIAERLRRSTVQVLDGGRGGGSGIIWNDAGLVLTNAHVVRGPAAQVELWNGARLSAKLLKQDDRRDLAALKIDASGLPVAPSSAVPALRAGELVIAVGNPLGFIGAVSTGVVHAVGPLAGFGRRSWIQSSVRLAPGNSGGPLANALGEVVGVNTMIAGLGSGRNLALAIPVAAVRQFLSRSDNEGATLGVIVRPVSIPSERAPGFLILETTPGAPAEKASLLIGDLLIGVNGLRFLNFSDLEHAIETAVDGRLTLQFRRGGRSQERSVTIQLNVPTRRAAAA
jgi:serine protease Do